MSESEVMAKLARVGELHVSFRYPTPMAAKKAWERAEKRMKMVSVTRHLDGYRGAHHVTVLGEEEFRSEFEKVERLLDCFGAERAEIKEGTLLTLRERRQAKYIAVSLDDDAPLRGRRRYGEQGAFSLPGGVTILRRNQG